MGQIQFTDLQYLHTPALFSSSKGHIFYEPPLMSQGKFLTL